ncbi:hypothetical protein LTR05_001387 [Lithohypha guttulata]|uniref:Uncharacterized protein n=1 Tax=Lithohypha guttulata TaxID=1690604 RepID=A0AAN7T7G2_9EURO|nr:hypothetical protein LTR05_001387 [Lithohypha guttulata]
MSVQNNGVDENITLPQAPKEGTIKPDQCQEATAEQPKTQSKTEEATEPDQLSVHGREAVDALYEQFGEERGYTKESLTRAAKTVDDLLPKLVDGD